VLVVVGVGVPVGGNGVGVAGGRFRANNTSTQYNVDSYVSIGKLLLP